jgi:hypothetical protein
LNFVAKELYQKEYDECDDTQKPLVQADNLERLLAYAFIHFAGTGCTVLRDELKRNFTKGTNQYPTTMAQALSYAQNCATTTPVSSTSEGVAFAQKGGTGKGSKSATNNKNNSAPVDMSKWATKACNTCGALGHAAYHCPLKNTSKEVKAAAKAANTTANTSKPAAQVKAASDADNRSVQTQLLQQALDSLQTKQDDGTALFQHHTFFQNHTFATIDNPTAVTSKAYQFTTSNKLDLNLRNVILLDSQSTLDLFCNPKLVRNIHKSCVPTRMQSNGGTVTLRHKAQVDDGYHLDVWFDKDAITNIVALKNLITLCDMTYSKSEESFFVHREEFGLPDMQFQMHHSGLHYHDPTDLHNFQFVTTVSGNKAHFTARQIQGAQKARCFYSQLAYPSFKDFCWVIQSNLVKDCPVTVADIDVATAIWGTDIASLKGKTPRSKPAPVVSDFVKIPESILDMHKDVILLADIFFVNKIPFFMTISRNLCFLTVNHLADRKPETIFAAYKTVHAMYLHRGFRIKHVNLDGIFGPIQALIQELGTRANLASANEHVPEAEQHFGLVCPSLLMVIHMVFQCTRLLNYFPTKGGISDTISPRTLLLGETLDYKKQFRLSIGDYCQVHENDTPRNSQLPRTQGAICLGPSGNTQGGYYFMSLRSGLKITRYSWTFIPMPDTVIAWVDTLGSAEPEILSFADCRGRKIGEIDAPDVDPDELTGVDNGLDTLLDPQELPTGVPDDGHPAVDELADVPTDVTIPTPKPEPALEAKPEPIPTLALAPEPDIADDPTVRRSNCVSGPPTAYIPSFEGKKYDMAQPPVMHPDAHMAVFQLKGPTEPEVVHAIMTQLSLKVGLKRWGEKAKDAARSEMKQLHMCNTFQPLLWQNIPEDQKKTVLESHMFLKEKRDGKIKGRTVAGGNKQRDFISKEDASSPTVCWDIRMTDGRRFLAATGSSSHSFISTSFRHHFYPGANRGDIPVRYYLQI